MTAFLDFALVSIYTISASLQTCNIKWTLPPDYPGAYWTYCRVSAVRVLSFTLNKTMKRVKMLFMKLIRWRNRFKQGELSRSPGEANRKSESSYSCGRGVRKRIIETWLVVSRARRET